jgi:hypothetical protein
MTVKKPKLVLGLSVFLVLCGIILAWVDSSEDVAGQIDNITINYGFMVIGIWFSYHSLKSMRIEKQCRDEGSGNTVDT